MTGGQLESTPNNLGNSEVNSGSRSPGIDSELLLQNGLNNIERSLVRTLSGVAGNDAASGRLSTATSSDATRVIEIASNTNGNGTSSQSIFSPNGIQNFQPAVVAETLGLVQAGTGIPLLPGYGAGYGQSQPGYGSGSNPFQPGYGRQSNANGLMGQSLYNNLFNQGRYYQNPAGPWNGTSITFPLKPTSEFWQFDDNSGLYINPHTGQLVNPGNPNSGYVLLNPNNPAAANLATNRAGYPIDPVTQQPLDLNDQRLYSGDPNNPVYYLRVQNTQSLSNTQIFLNPENGQVYSAANANNRIVPQPRPHQTTGDNSGGNTCPNSSNTRGNIGSGGGIGGGGLGNMLLRMGMMMGLMSLFRGGFGGGFGGGGLGGLFGASLLSSLFMGGLNGGGIFSPFSNFRSRV